MKVHSTRGDRSRAVQVVLVVQALVLEITVEALVTWRISERRPRRTEKMPLNGALVGENKLSRSRRSEYVSDQLLPEEDVVLAGLHVRCFLEGSAGLWRF